MRQLRALQLAELNPAARLLDQFTDDPAW